LLPGACRWGGFASIQYIDVSNNALGGFLPATWGQVRPLRVLDVRSNCGICGGFPPLQNNVTIYFSGTNLDTTCNAFNCAVPFFGNLLLAVGVVQAFAQQAGQVVVQGRLARHHLQ
jgi:hypothetical protein